MDEFAKTVRSLGGDLASIFAARANAGAAASTVAANQSATQAQLISGDNRTKYLAIGAVALALGLFILTRKK